MYCQSIIPNISLRDPVLFNMIKDYSRYVYFDMFLRPLKFPVLMIFNHWLTPTPPLLKVYLSVIMFEKYLLNRVFFFIYVMAMLQYILHVFMLIRIHYWERKFILFSNNFSGFFNLIIDFLSTSSMAIMGFSRNILLECTVLVDILLLWKAFTQLHPFERSCHLSSETPVQLNIFSEGSLREIN